MFCAFTGKGTDVATLTEKQKYVIRAFADNDMNVSETARNSFCHRNTITYHLEKIYEDTGLDPRNFYDLVTLLSMIGEEK